MKTAKNHILMCAGLLMFALASCADPVRPETAEHVPEGRGLARIQLSAGEPAQRVRTAVPNMAALYFTLDFTAAPDKAVSATLRGSSSITVELEPADWNLEVNGYTDPGPDAAPAPAPADLQVTGRISFSVTAGISKSFDVDLTPAFSSGGTGSLEYSISFPASARGFLGLYPIDNTPGTSQEVDISFGAGGTASGTLPSPLVEGTYQAVIDLYDSTDNKAATRTEAVHIYHDLPTLLDWTFGATDFAACPALVGGGTLAAKLDTALNSASGTYNTIVLDGEGDLTSFNPKPLDAGNNNITIILRGNGKTVQLSSVGSLFTLKATSGSLTLELHDIKLRGMSGNNVPLVQVTSGGVLVMKAGSLITDNKNSASSSSSPTFPGGGVYVNGGTFTMSGGAVSGNTATSSSSNAVGGGVYVNGGTFDMSGGAVSGNEASASASTAYGGGVYVIGTFTMSGGAVSGNEASTTASTASGGGVYVNSGTFDMSGGAVSGNTAAAAGSSNTGGGGVYVAGVGTFDMSGGAVSGNEASATVTASAAYGGGVYVSSGTFTKSGGGAIYGDTDTTHTAGSAENTASSGNGHAVYVYVSSSISKKRDNTAGPEVDLYSAKSAEEGGGWE